MLKSRRLIDIFITIFVEPKSYRDLILDLEGLNKKELLYI